MAKKTAEGEQMDLIEDLHGPDSQKIKNKATEYRSTIDKRLKIQEKEAKLKSELIDMVKEAGVKPIKKEDGKEYIHCKIGEVEIEQTHEEKENVKVKVNE